MAFSADVKRELSEIFPRETHCQRAELAGFLVNGSLELPEREILEKNCCKRAFLRGLFLSGGSFTDPEKVYRAELYCSFEALSAFAVSILREFGIQAKTVVRNGKHVVYLKDGNQSADFLAVVGANRSLLELENIRVLKDVRNHVNRSVNCETANLQKTVSAGVSQLRDIERIRRGRGLDALPDALREVAVLRMQHPEATLLELAALCDPPVGKSGINHRLRRLHELAEEEGL